MVKANLTRNTRVIAGGNSWAVDLSSSINSFTVSNSASIDSLTVLKSNAVQKVINSSTISVSLGTLYYGDESKLLASHQGDTADSYVALIDDVSKRFYAGIYQVTGVPMSAPTDAIITQTAELIQNGSWFGNGSSNGVTEFAFSSTNLTDPIAGTFANTDTVYLVVTEYPSGTASADFTIAGVTQTVDDVGMWEIDISTKAASLSTQAVALAHTIASGKFLRGFVLIGTPFTVD